MQMAQLAAWRQKCTHQLQLLLLLTAATVLVPAVVTAVALQAVTQQHPAGGAGGLGVWQFNVCAAKSSTGSTGMLAVAAAAAAASAQGQACCRI
jgi:hypothetical protein